MSRENKYDDPSFFDKYSQMTRSVKGLEGAGEWNTLRAMLPGFAGKRVLDLGCGYGWHCIYAAEQGAAAVTGVDISERMLAKARSLTSAPGVTYCRASIEDYEYPENSFDAVVSSLALHYIESYDDVCAKVWRCLTEGGHFVFSVEHPIFTAQGDQDWARDHAGDPLHWPVDRYFAQGERTARFLGEDVVKYHRTLNVYVQGLLTCGFAVEELREPMPPQELMDMPGMKDELRRPMMLIIRARKGR